MDANLSHSASSSNLNLASNLHDLRLDNKRLTEELAHCKADKEFIWLLWKQFQKESPDLAATVDMIMTREKVKQEEVNKKVSLSVQAKDEELSVLKSMIDVKEKEVSNQRKRLSDVECQYCQLQKDFQTQIHLSQQNAQQLSEVLTKNEEFRRQKDELEQLIDLKEKEFKQQLKKLEQESAQKDQLNQKLEAKMHHLGSLQQEVIEYQQQAKRLESECKAVSERCHYLSQQLQLNDQQLMKEREQNQLKNLQMKELREQLKVKSNLIDTWTKEVTIKSSIAKQLHTKDCWLKAESATKEESVHSVMEESKQCDEKVANSRPSPLSVKMTAGVKRKSTDKANADNGAPNLVKVLELTEQELFDCKVQLNAKSEELLGLRSSHDRRVERMQTLDLNYKLLLEQLKTYETESKKKSIECTISKKDVSRRLRHENSEKVWNELSLYKTKCEDLKKQMLFLEEERDTIQTKCLRNQTTITELRARLHHQRSDLERKLSAIACVESLSLGESSSLNEVKHLKLRVEELLQVEKQASRQNRELEKELKLHCDEVNKLQLTITEIRDTDVNKMKKLCKSSVTKVDIIPVSQADIIPVSRTDASIQVSLPVNKPEMKDAQVSPLRSVVANSSDAIATPTTRRRSRKRTYSDGEILIQQKRLPSSTHGDLFTHSFIDSKQDSGHISSRRISGKPHKSTLEKERRPHKIPFNDTECSCSYHKCMWQHKAKCLQQRLNVASEQVSVLTMSNLAMSQSLEQIRLESDKAKRELTLRVEGHKAALKSLQREKQELRETVLEQQKSISKLKREAAQLGKRTDTEWKRLETDQKELYERCLRLKVNVKSLEESLQQKTMEVTHMQESNTRRERDVRQKRQLIEDLRTKLKQEKEKLCRSDEKVKTLTNEAVTLSEINDQQKHKLEVLRSQLSDQTNDKERLIEMLTNCQKELEHTIQQLQISQNLLKQHKRQDAEMELTQLKEQVKRYKDKLHQAECSLQETQIVVQEFTTFTMELGRKLFHHLHRENSKSDPADVSARVREIARDTLKLSDGELDDFFKEESSDNTEQEYLRQFINLIASATKSKPPFASKLLKNFTEYVIRLKQ